MLVFLNCKQLNYGIAEHIYVLIIILHFNLMDFLAVSPKPPLTNLIEKKERKEQRNPLEQQLLSILFVLRH